MPLLKIFVHRKGCNSGRISGETDYKRPKMTKPTYPSHQKYQAAENSAVTTVQTGYFAMGYPLTVTG